MELRNQDKDGTLEVWVWFMTEENHLPAGPLKWKVPNETPADVSDWKSLVSRRKIGVGFWIAAAGVLILGCFAPVLPFKEPNENFIVFEQKKSDYRKNAGWLYNLHIPRGDHWLGTDQDARDLLS